MTKFFTINRKKSCKTLKIDCIKERVNPDSKKDIFRYKRGPCSIIIPIARSERGDS